MNPAGQTLRRMRERRSSLVSRLPVSAFDVYELGRTIEQLNEWVFKESLGGLSDVGMEALGDRAGQYMRLALRIDAQL